MIDQHEARVNITWNGQNFELPDPVHFEAADGDVKQWAAEAIRAGFAGVAADPNINLQNHVVDRFPKAANPAPGQRDHNLIQIRPKTAYGLTVDALEARLDRIEQSLG